MDVAAGDGENNGGIDCFPKAPMPPESNELKLGAAAVADEALPGRLDVPIRLPGTEDPNELKVDDVGGLDKLLEECSEEEAVELILVLEGVT